MSVKHRITLLVSSSFSFDRRKEIQAATSWHCLPGSAGQEGKSNLPIARVCVLSADGVWAESTCSHFRQPFNASWLPEWR